MGMIENFEAMLANGKDSALLRFSLGNAYLQTAESSLVEKAITHLVIAVQLDKDYSAAWKLLGKAYAASAHIAKAKVAYQEGIRAATAKGDKQAAKEMAVFLKRLDKENN
jgi:predicted Zn-dependent protease